MHPDAEHRIGLRGPAGSRGKRLRSVWRRGSRGVTLLELMAGVTLAATLAAMAGAELSGILARNHEDLDVRELETHIREARTLARSELSEVRVTFDARTLHLRSTTGTSRDYALGTSIAALALLDAPELTFRASGGTNTAGPVVLQATTARGQTRQIVVYPAIGAVRLGP